MHPHIQTRASTHIHRKALMRAQTCTQHQPYSISFLDERPFTQAELEERELSCLCLLILTPKLHGTVSQHTECLLDKPSQIVP